MNPVRPAARVEAIDLLRGLVMVVMALDHVRDYLMPLGNPVDLATTFPALFFTRFVTHYCAPTFYFLAGVGAFYSTRKRTPAEVSWFLLTRGLWLVFLELVVVRFGWYFTWDWKYFEGLTIWALGWSMVALAGLIRLPRWLLLSVGGLLVVGHNALDGIKPESVGMFGPLWTVLHNVGQIPLGSAALWIQYPLVPWIGVMALGFGFGTEGVRKALRIGPAMIVAFLVLRFSNLYGDPHPWVYQKNAVFTVMAFLNCEKYPPSLLYLLMTLGPSITIIGLVEWWQSAWWQGTASEGAKKRALPGAAQLLILVGRVPMFYYLLHVYLAHILGIAVAMMRFGNVGGLLQMPGALGLQTIPSNSPLWAVYVTWLVLLALLYPACKWFAGVKARGAGKAWLSYL